MPSERELDDAVARLQADPGLRAVVAAARSWGISPSRMRGREPAVTVHGDTHRREPEWTTEDTALAIGLAVVEADVCGGCGGLLSETTKPENEDRWIPGAPVRCHRCTALSIGEGATEESPHRSALRIPVRDLRSEHVGLADVDQRGEREQQEDPAGE